MNIARVLEKHLNKKLDFEKDIILYCNGLSGTKINEWNLSEKQPTKEELKTICETYKDEIEKEIAIENLNNKHYRIMLDKMFEDYKTNDNDYKKEAKDIK